MENQRAIPQGYMTTGELAKRMGVTVRTLQHYGREGLLHDRSLFCKDIGNFGWFVK